jgi:uncharacterized membrane protein
MVEFIYGLFDSYYYSTLHHAVIIVHVLTALLAVVVAPVAMIATKGGPAHILWGRIYFWAMITTNLLALWLLSWRFNTFLFGIVVLTLYGALTGYRAPHRKEGQVRWFDWTLSIAAMTTGVALIACGILTGLGVTAQFMPSDGGLNIILVILPVVFGMSIISDSWTDIRSFRTPSSDRRWWWYYHMERMLGSYIGLTTALMVQQVGPHLDKYGWIAWILPTAVGTPLVIMWINRYRRKFAKSAQPVSTQAPLANT